MTTPERKDSPLTALRDLGQSVWLDFITRDLIRTGELGQLVQRDYLRGVTSNPSIFERAIGETDDYDRDLERLAAQDKEPAEIYEELAVSTIQEAADVLRGVYDETGGRDGFVSLEVSPHLARDTEGTVSEVRRLWGEVDRPNVMIKIPGTAEGLPAIRRCLADGININITLLFGLQRYAEVAGAYMQALEARADRGQPFDRIASVASFFLSRIDVLVDPKLEALADGGHQAELARELHGMVAVCCARAAYLRYRALFSSDRWKRLERRGARTQRLLWASTSTKNPDYSDVKYVDALAGPDTVNTMPMETLDAYRDHGDPAPRLVEGLSHASRLLARLPELGIDLEEVAAQLVEEGIEKFNAPYDELLETLAKRAAA